MPAPAVPSVPPRTSGGLTGGILNRSPGPLSRPPAPLPGPALPPPSPGAAAARAALGALARGLALPAALALAGLGIFAPPVANDDAILDRLKKPKKPKFEPPVFSGGQCAGVSYKGTVETEYDKSSGFAEGTKSYHHFELYGPIEGIIKTINGAYENYVVRGRDFEGKIRDSGYTSGGIGFVNYSRIIALYRVDGQPDICGNPPTPVSPGEQRNGLPGQPPQKPQEQRPPDPIFPPIAPGFDIEVPPNTPITIDNGTDIIPTIIINSGDKPQIHFPSPWSFNPNNPNASPNTGIGVGTSGGTTTLTSPGTSPVIINLPGHQPIVVDPTGQTPKQGLTPSPFTPHTFTPTPLAPNPLTPTTPNQPQIPNQPQTPNQPQIPNTPNQPNTDLQTILTGLGIITTIVTQIKNNTTTKALEDAAAAGTCRTTQPGGCMSKAINDSNANQTKDLKDAVDAGFKGLDLTLLATINDKLGNKITGGLSGGLGRLFSFKAVDRIINLATFAGVVHNAMMLSNSIGDTFFSALDNILAIPALIVNPDAETVDTKAVFTKHLDGVFAAIFGETEWTAIKAQWKAYSTIYNTGAQIFGNVRDIIDETQNIQQTTNNWVAELGNGLTDEGLISEDNWEYKDPKQKPKGKYFGRLESIRQKLETVENVFEDLEQVTGSARSIVETANEIKDNADAINKAITDANKAAADDRATKEEGLELPNFSLEDIF